MQLYLITGYSGAGKSVAMKSCEDVGVACMDNIPISAIPAVIASVAKAPIKKVAICCDVRCVDFDAGLLLQTINDLRKSFHCTIVFLQSRFDVLIGRYNATKHRHPLYNESEQSIISSLLQEKSMLDDLLLGTDLIIDTSDYTPHLLKRQMQRIMGVNAEAMCIAVMSFSYQQGLPPNADLVFDVRFLRNPHYEPNLQSQTGRDEAVTNFIQNDVNFAPFFVSLQEMLDRLIPLYQDEGKSYLTIAFGCTGGKHRSVFFAEHLYSHLKQQNMFVDIYHRELKIGSGEL
jgi:UPF0042 nucleotide-binding protein